LWTPPLKTRTERFSCAAIFSLFNFSPQPRSTGRVVVRCKHPINQHINQAAHRRIRQWP
jgi:hypothetical protein